MSKRKRKRERERVPPEDEALAQEWLKRRTRRSFVTGGLAALAGFSAWHWLGTRRDDAGIPWPLRRMLDLNGDLWREYFKPDRMASFPPPPPGKKPRVNGDLGLGENFDLSTWKLNIPAAGASSSTDSKVPSDAEDEALSLNMADIRWLPKTESSTEFRCIEGWSDFISYAGVRFSEFLDRYELGKRDDGSWYPYVGLETPDGKYYVSIDMESMLHPQTVLAYEMNGQPLSLKDGAPLRLVIPIKYGIKSLKRIGTIRFSETRPPDYWAERGYDWFAGL